MHFTYNTGYLERYRKFVWSFPHTTCSFSLDVALPAAATYHHWYLCSLPVQAICHLYLCRVLPHSYSLSPQLSQMWRLPPFSIGANRQNGKPYTTVQTNCIDYGKDGILLYRINSRTASYCYRYVSTASLAWSGPSQHFILRQIRPKIHLKISVLTNQIDFMTR